MPRRRTRNSDNRFASEDSPIGLTSAFAPVKGPQSVDYDATDDPVGLTQAFGAVPEQDEPHAWDEAGKWVNFDWNASFDSGSDARETENAAEKTYGDEAAPAAPEDAEDKSAADSNTPRKAKDAPAGKPPASSAGSAPASSGASRRGRHAAPEPTISPRMKRSQRTRRILIVLVILLIVVIGALGFFVFRTFSSSQQEAAQQTQEQVSTPKDDIADAPTTDATESTTHLADVPDLTSLFGLTADEAIPALGRGALVTSNREVNEEGNPIKTNLNVALTEETADSRTGTPTVYLGLGEDGKVRQVGYSASASALGFGSLSFADAVNNEHVIEKTLEKAGISVPSGSAVLPANKDEYSTYGSDGTTVVRERCSFEGATDVRGVPSTWSAVLSYDYTTQVVTGNLSDTVRIIYVYVTMN